MPNLYQNWRLAAEVVGGVLFVILLAWFFFFRSTPALVPGETPAQGTFDSQSSIGIAGTGTSGQAANQGEAIVSPLSQQKVFKISDGPVAGASFMQEMRPTTTIARFVMQQNGHVLDLAIDSPGSVARASSNTTIPGVSRVVWEMQQSAGRTVAAGAIMQYTDNGTVKTVLLNFPLASTTASSSASAPVRIKFLPNDLVDIAASPAGTSIAYLVAVQGGVDGYLATSDGFSPKKLFSLPLSQVVLSWPSASTLLVASKSAAGVAGIAFSVNTASGAVSPLLYALGLTAIADPTFGHVIYQTSGAGRSTYSHDTKTNIDRTLSFDPIPEKCVWSREQAGVMYCAAPLAYVPPNYADLWHQGTASAADSVFAFNLTTGKTTVLATPGGTEGGLASDILEMSLSSDDKYLLFIKKGDRSLWGVRLY